MSGGPPREAHDMCDAKVAAGDGTIIPVIDFQLKAIKVFCLIVNIPFSEPVSLNSPNPGHHRQIFRFV